MWVLEKIDDDGSSLGHWILFVGRSFKIGRKDCDVLVDDDKSVSREHAFITVGTIPPEHVRTPSVRPPIEFTDKGSRFGSFINKIKCAPGATVLLQEGDTISVGAHSVSIFKLKYIPVVCCSSGLTEKSKGVLQNTLLKIGAHFVEDVTQCTYIIMKEIRVTSKLLLALLQNNPIVSPDWLEALVNLPSIQTPLPDYHQYLPKYGTTELSGSGISFFPSPLRKVVFAEKTFVTLSDQDHNLVADMIVKGGGSVIKLEDGTRNIEKFLNTLSGTIYVVMTSLEGDRITETLQKKIDAVRKTKVATCSSEVGSLGSVVSKEPEKIENSIPKDSEPKQENPKPVVVDVTEDLTKSENEEQQEEEDRTSRKTRSSKKKTTEEEPKLLTTRRTRSSAKTETSEEPATKKTPASPKRTPISPKKAKATATTKSSDELTATKDKKDPTELTSTSAKPEIVSSNPPSKTSASAAATPTKPTPEKPNTVTTPDSADPTFKSPQKTPEFSFKTPFPQTPASATSTPTKLPLTPAKTTPTPTKTPTRRSRVARPNAIIADPSADLDETTDQITPQKSQQTTPTKTTAQTSPQATAQITPSISQASTKTSATTSVIADAIDAIDEIDELLGANKAVPKKDESKFTKSTKTAQKGKSPTPAPSTTPKTTPTSKDKSPPESFSSRTPSVHKFLLYQNANNVDEMMDEYLDNKKRKREEEEEIQPTTVLMNVIEQPLIKKDQPPAVTGNGWNSKKFKKSSVTSTPNVNTTPEKKPDPTTAFIPNEEFTPQQLEWIRMATEDAREDESASVTSNNLFDTNKKKLA